MLKMIFCHSFGHFWGLKKKDEKWSELISVFNEEEPNRNRKSEKVLFFTPNVAAANVWIDPEHLNFNRIKRRYLLPISNDRWIDRSHETQINHFDRLYTSIHHVRIHKTERRTKLASWIACTVIYYTPAVSQTSKHSNHLKIWIFKLRVVWAEIHILNIDNTE